MSNARREIHIIEEAEQDGAGAGSEPQSAERPSGAFGTAEGAPAPAAEPQVAAPFSTDPLKGIDVESYIAGSSLGVALRQARLKRKLGLEDVSNVLRIRKDYLQAIEQGNYRALPGPTYAVGFIRAYAEHLGLHAGDAVRRYKEEVGYVRAGPNLSFPQPSSESRLPGLALLAGAALTIGILYGAWYMFSPAEPPAGEQAAEQQATTQTPEPSPAPAPVGGAAPTMVPAASPPEAVAPAAQPVEAQPQTPASAPADVDSQAGGAPAAEQAAAAPSGRVVVSVVSDSWVQVRNAEGAVVFTKLLRPGEAYEVPADQQGLTLLTGNAGAVRVSVDGRMLPLLGSSGEVRRDIPLDADKLLAGAGTSN